MTRLQTLKKIYLLTGIIFSLLFISVSVVAQSLTQSYGADTPLQKGMIVGLKKDDLRKVEAINYDQFEAIHGVVIGANDSNVILGREDEKIYVAKVGRYMVLVSDQTGDVSPGDYVTVSAVSGIGMKATQNDPVVLGKAMEAFKSSDKNQVIGTATLKDASGKERHINIGHITVDVSIGKNPKLKTDDSLPQMLRRASELIAGKPVAPVRVYMSLVVLVLATMIAGSLIYSAVRSSLIAIGRNPLSKKSIIRGLFQVVLIGLMVFLSGVFGVYLLLKL
jgi:hypothetical protein